MDGIPEGFDFGSFFRNDANNHEFRTPSPPDSQGFEQNFSFDNISGSSTAEVERLDHTNQLQLAQSHRQPHHRIFHNDDLQHSDLRTLASFIRAPSPLPPHNSFPLECPDYPTNDVNFDEWTDHAAYCGSEAEPELANIPSNEENASLSKYYFTTQSAELLHQVVDHQVIEDSPHIPDAALLHHPRPQTQASHLLQRQHTEQAIDYDGFALQEPNLAATKDQQQPKEQPRGIVTDENPPKSSNPPSLIVKLKVRFHRYTMTPARPQNPATHKVAKILAKPPATQISQTEDLEEENEVEDEERENYGKEEEEYIDSEGEKPARKKVKTSRRN
ncbi:hypothetical protein NHQ30_008836 [Ciborinia camelliae]|nr:hypothetical protein NHQ30_008836 [Ciborinia camelliae]